MCVCGSSVSVMVVCLHPAGGCQKRFREDVGSDDRDFIKRMKGDFDTRFREAQLDQTISILPPPELQRSETVFSTKYSPFFSGVVDCHLFLPQFGDRVMDLNV